MKKLELAFNKYTSDQAVCLYAAQVTAQGIHNISRTLPGILGTPAKIVAVGITENALKLWLLREQF